MTNLEMHKDLILNLVHTKYNECLSPFGYAVASFCGSYDWEIMLKWLFSEYEPTLLENGDDLKPGDWIMVRDGDGVSWRKRQFMCYLNNHFYCFKPHSRFKNECDCVMWAQARLPEERE